MARGFASVRTILCCLGLLAAVGATAKPGAADPANWVTAVEDVAQQVGPAVVSIKTEQLEYYSIYRRPYGQSDFFDQFFADFFGGNPGYTQHRQGLGSGVIIDPQGYILTNEHVVRGADVITVMLPDGRSFPGELQGTDPRSDLAVIKIAAPDLPVARLGESEDLRIGQWVVAIGNPFGHVLDDPAPTVTTGVVSALHRALPRTSRRDSDYSDLIQTDAAINPGNSGGPLVNLDGEIIGINVAIFSTSGGYQGIGFAVPINYAKSIVEQITTGQAFASGWIGVHIQDLSPRLAAYFGLPAGGRGVLVLQVVPGSPAEQAGLQDGDVILAVNDIKMRSGAALIRYISNTSPGTTLTVRRWRDGQEADVSVQVGAPTNPATEEAGLPPDPSAALLADWRGLRVSSRQGGDADEGQTADGVLVVEVQPNSPAALSGLRRGDVIIAINKQPVTSIAEYRTAVAAVTGSSLVRTERGFFIVEEQETR